MIKQKNHLLLICIIVSIFNFKSHSQSKKSNDNYWQSFIEAAHGIGFCAYHKQQETCNEHSQIKYELEKINDPESDTYYFQLDSIWAKKRLDKLAESKSSKSEDYLILFDIDQGSIKQLYDAPKTSNSYKMFSIFDLKDTLEFKIIRGTFYISSNKTNSILSNTLWREFMSNRLGRLDSKIEISLSGTNILNDYNKFKHAFIRFKEK